MRREDLDNIIRKAEVLSSAERRRLAGALVKIQEEVRWKPAKGLTHLDKRRKMKHLDQAASISDYEELIHEIVRNKRNILYLYEFGRTHYYAARGIADGNDWIVLFGAGGLMETAFPPENIDDYLVRRGFIFLGYIEEVLKWTKKVKK